MFAKDAVNCFCHGSVKAVDQGVYFDVLIFKSEEWSKLSSYCCLKNVCDVGVLEFLQTERNPYGSDSRVALSGVPGLRLLHVPQLHYCVHGNTFSWYPLFSQSFAMGATEYLAV